MQGVPVEFRSIRLEFANHLHWNAGLLAVLKKETKNQKNRKKVVGENKCSLSVSRYENQKKAFLLQKTVGLGRGGYSQFLFMHYTM